MTSNRLRAIRYDKLRGVPSNTILGRKNPGTGPVQALSAATVRSIISSGDASSIFVGTTTHTIENTTTETTLCKVASASDFEGDLTIGSMVKGDVLRFTAAGSLTGDTVSPGTLTFKAKLGSDVILTVATGTDINSTANRIWRLDGSITINDADASSTVRGSAVLVYENFNGVGTPVPVANSVGSLDLSGTVEFDLTATWSIADSDNVLTVQQVLLERLAPTPSP